MFGSHALGLKEGLQPTFVFIKLGRTQVQSAFCITRQHQVATISIYVRVNRQITFQNTFSGLGGRNSNAPPAQSRERYTQ